MTAKSGPYSLEVLCNIRMLRAVRAIPRPHFS